MKWDALIQAYLDHLPKLDRYETSVEDSDKWHEQWEEIQRLRKLQEQEAREAA